MQSSSVLQVVSVNVGLPRAADITRLYHQDKHNLDLLRRVVAMEALPDSWRDYFLKRLTHLKGAN